MKVNILLVGKNICNLKYLAEELEYQHKNINFLLADNLETAQKIIEKNVIHYFIMDINSNNFNTVNKLITISENKASITIKDLNGIRHQIIIENIIYITSNDHIMTIVTKHEIYQSRELSLKNFISILPSNFIRCHKGFIVNLHYISYYDNKDIYLQLTHSNIIIPIGKQYKQKAEALFKKLL